MLGVSLRILHIWCRWYSLLSRDPRFRNFRISVCFYSALPDGRICSTCSTG